MQPLWDITQMATSAQPMRQVQNFYQVYELSGSAPSSTSSTCRKRRRA